MKFFYITDEIMADDAVETIHIREICGNLVRLGHSLTLYAPSASAVDPGAVYETKLIHNSRWLASLTFQLRLYRRLWRDIAAHRPDVFYVRNNNILIVPALVAQVCNIPLVLECNGMLLDESKLIERSLLGRTLIAFGVFRMIESYNARVARKLIVVAKGIEDYFLTNYGVREETICLISNGVDTDLLRPEDRSVSRARIGLRDDAVMIGYVGSFYPWQGLRYVVEAARLVAERRPAATFLIVGRGEDEAYMREFIVCHDLESVIEIRPAVPHDLVPAHINALDICLCYPTAFRAHATSPFKVYEYLACGKAVVVSDIAGMREEFGDCVAYTAPESPEALAETLVALIDDADERGRLGAKGRAFVQNDKSWLSVTEKIVNLCAELIA